MVSGGNGAGKVTAIHLISSMRMKPEKTFKWSSCGRTHVGTIRKVNQDAYANLPEKQLWIVADGMGGHKDGEVASNKIVGAFQNFEAEKTIGSTANKIHQQLTEVNGELIELATGKNEVIGSTVVALYAQQQHAIVIWSGDSRLYLFRRGQLKQLSRDHNNESNLLLKGFSREEVKVHPYAQILTHAIGGEEMVYLDAQILEVIDNDLFLLCSDGLNKEVSDSEIEACLEQMPYTQAIDSLMELSLQRGGRDNITVVMVQAGMY